MKGHVHPLIYTDIPICIDIGYNSRRQSDPLGETFVPPASVLM